MIAGRISLVVACVYHDSHCDIYSLGYGLHTITAGPMLTQPSLFLRGTIK